MAALPWLLPLLARHGRQLADEFGIVPDKEAILGCGRWGCVFATTDPYTVVKITEDSTEVVAHLAVEDRRERHPRELAGIVRASRAGPGPRMRGVRLYVIVREAIEPLSEAAQERWEAPLWEARKQAKRLARACSEQAVAKARQDLELRLRALDKVPALRGVVRAMRFLGSRGDLLLDVHVGNVGKALTSREHRRRGDVVIYDLGQAPAS